MVQSFIATLKDWYALHDDRAKMQQLLLATAVMLVVVAGLISLVNYNLGQTILFIAGLLFATFFINALAWALAHTFLFPKLRRSVKRSTTRNQ